MAPLCLHVHRLAKPVHCRGGGLSSPCSRADSSPSHLFASICLCLHVHQLAKPVHSRGDGLSSPCSAFSSLSPETLMATGTSQTRPVYAANAPGAAWDDHHARDRDSDLQSAQ